MDHELEKINGLMVECGLSAESAGKICEAIMNYTGTYKATLDEQYTAKLEAARKICIEETEAHKLETSRRVQVFLEARTEQIEQSIANKVAVKEGEAMRTLTNVQGLLEGIPAGGDLALKESNSKLRSQLVKITEERNTAIAKANRQTEIANKVLKRNRIAESKLATIEASNKTISEDRKPAQRTTKRIDGERRGGQPSTTRPTIVENQDRRAPIDTRRSNVKSNGGQSGILTPSQIAESISEMP